MRKTETAKITKLQTGFSCRICGEFTTIETSWHDPIICDDCAKILRAIIKEREETVLNVAPAVHAHWEDCSNGWMCSNCFRDSTYDTEYCPHCGAKMDA